MQFGDRVKQLRESVGMTQAELGKKVGVSDRVIGYYESNNRFPKKQEIIIKLAEVFGVSVDYLLVQRAHDPESGIQPIQDIDSPINTHNVLKKVELLFAGGQLNDEDKEKIFHAITEIYVESRLKK